MRQNSREHSQHDADDTAIAQHKRHACRQHLRTKKKQGRPATCRIYSPPPPPFPVSLASYFSIIPPVASHPASAPHKNASSNSNASFLEAAAAVVIAVVVVMATAVAVGATPSTAFSVAAVGDVVAGAVGTVVETAVLAIVGFAGKAGTAPPPSLMFAVGVTAAGVLEGIIDNASAESLKPWMSIHCNGGQALRPSHCCPDSCPKKTRFKPASTDMR